jgi:hypothetical protein
MDILERLREPIVADAFESGSIRNGVLAERMIRERIDAADEIERLRTALRELLDDPLSDIRADMRAGMRRLLNDAITKKPDPL